MCTSSIEQSPSREAVFMYIHNALTQQLMWEDMMECEVGCQGHMEWSHFSECPRLQLSRGDCRLHKQKSVD